MSNHCLCPWVHTFASPQMERRLCCASREPTQNFKQYIDSNETLKTKSEKEVRDKIKFLTLEEHWNSEHMKSVRRRMMNGETLPECEVCDKKLLNTNVYRSYFNKLFAHMREKVIEQTDPDGTHHGLPVSFDYRYTNLCNFKCRMCGPSLSSSWETEYIIAGRSGSEPWMPYKAEIEEFRKTLSKEFLDSIDTIQEIYWVGGEPLMWDQHWKYMRKLVDIGRAGEVYIRYNTNLSRIEYKNVHLFKDILSNFDWQINASIDGTGKIGEYIRTGLNYEKFKKNFAEGVKAQRNSRQMRLDFTLTTPGLFEIERMVELSQEFNVQLLSKVCFAFTSNVAMCPLFLPKHILHKIVNNILKKIEFRCTPNHVHLVNMLTHLLKRSVFSEEYKDFEEGRIRGKARIIELEQIRKDTYTMSDIFKENNIELYEWWEDIK